MLFKVIISAIQYIVNPDLFTEKEKGMFGILKNAIITVMLIAITPTIFEFAINIQKDVIGALPKIILNAEMGRSTAISSTGSGGTDVSGNVGQSLAYDVLTSFIHEREGHPNGKVYDKLNASGRSGVQINNFESFLAYAGDGISFFGSGNRTYEYMIIISTIGGAFLVYILLSLALDVAIRAFKLAIIEMLSPIPISSYMFKKENFNKFVEMAMNVYLDLFIRMAVIFVILLFLQFVPSIMHNIFYGPDAFNTGSTGFWKWLEETLAKIALIFGLLMFAKSAPGFITDLLGLKNITGGDMKEMFKPAWQRTGNFGMGAARNAISNARSAWKNNGDMINGKGGKLRRAFQNAHRVSNAARHGMGGLAKGALDTAYGLAAGEDSKKIAQRHAAARQKSARNAAAGFMRRTDRREARDANIENKKNKKSLAEVFKARGLDIKNILKKNSAKAQAALTNRLAEIGNQIAEQQRILGNPNSSMEQRIEASRKLQNLQAERTRLQSKEGRAQFLKEMSRQFSISDAVESQIVENRTKFEANVKKIIQLQREISANPTADNSEKYNEIAKLETENDELNTMSGEGSKKKQNENNRRIAELSQRLELDPNDEAAKIEISNLEEQNKELQASIDDAKEKLKSVFSDQYDEYVKLDVTKKVKPNITYQSIMGGKIDQFFGGEGFTGQGYIDVADLLKNNRGALWSGEAMTKLQQMPHILERDGVEIKFTPSRDALGYDTGHEITYSEIVDLQARISNGRLSPNEIKAELDKYGIRSQADLTAAFKDVEKQAASEYVTLASEGAINNSTITEGLQRLAASIAASNIPKAEKNSLLAELEENPGKFLKKASDKQEKMRTQGSRISAFNSGKKDN